MCQKAQKKMTGGMYVEGQILFKVGHDDLRWCDHGWLSLNFEQGFEQSWIWKEATEQQRDYYQFRGVIFLVMI